MDADARSEAKKMMQNVAANNFSQDGNFLKFQAFAA
jgi:hypothetical protein